jgi:hypothetical protein
MTEQHSHGKHDADLDRLLAEARWPEPKREQLARLREQWRGFSRVRQRRRILIAGAAMAAAVLALTGVSIRWKSHSGPDTSTTTPKIVAVRPTDEAGQGRGTRTEVPLVRDPTLYERVLLTSYRPAPARQASAKKKRGRADHAVAAGASKSLPDNLLLTADAVARRTGELLFGALRSYEQFWGSARRQSGQLIAATAFRARQARSSAISTSAEGKAVEAVARTGEVSDIVNILVREPHRELRNRLLRELLSRGTEESVGAYLMFVALPQSREEALTALHAAGPGPSSVLLAFLRSPRGELRNAAALALAKSTDPSVVTALAASLEDAGLRRQALLALLLNPTPRAAAVLNEAREDLYLMASVRAAEFELQHVTNAYER